VKDSRIAELVNVWADKKAGERQQPAIVFPA